MQTVINSFQPRFTPGLINPNIACLPVPRITEDENCKAGGFAFEGSNPETQAVGFKAGATVDNIIGVIARVPFQSYNGGYNSIYLKGTDVTIVVKGNICVTATNTPAYKDKVFVNSTTGEIQTGTGDAPANFIDTGWRVTQTESCNNTVEISNIQFN